MRTIELQVARPEDEGTLANLVQLYTHDFSELWSGMSSGELGEDGRFLHYPLEAYWSEPSRIPLLLRHGGHIAGFALINDVSPSGRGVDRNIAEFFIVRKHRRRGLGRAAAHTIFNGYPGVWETAVARRNVGALAFWRNTIRGHPTVEDIEETDLTGPAWNGPVIRFRITAT